MENETGKNGAAPTLDSNQYRVTRTLDWEPHRKLIQELYVEQDTSLDRVRQLLQSQGFEATLSQYKRKLRSWGLIKTISSAEWQLIANSLKETHGKELMRRTPEKKLHVNGQVVRLSQVKRYLRRKQALASGSSNGDDEHQSSADAATITSNKRDCQSQPREYLSTQPAPPCTDTVATSISTVRESENSILLERNQDDSQVVDRGILTKHEKSMTVSPAAEHPFACPYSKYNPERYSERNTTERRYRGCSIILLRGISRLKQHLYRVHRKPLHCHRCFATFSDSECLEQHMKDISTCTISHDPFTDLMSPSQEMNIRKRKMGVNQVEHWFEVYQILFPDAPVPGSPYAGEAGNKDMSPLEHFVKLFRAIGTERASDLLETLSTLRPDSTYELAVGAMDQVRMEDDLLLPELPTNPFFEEMIDALQNDQITDTQLSGKNSLHMPMTESCSASRL